MKRALCLVLFAFACADEDDPVADGGVTGKDAPVADVPLPDVPVEPLDLGVADREIADVPSADADAGVALEPVTVRRAPEFASMRVVFHDPDGNVISTITSTAAEVRETVPSGSMITALPELVTQPYSLYTVVGVEPGETYDFYGNTFQTFVMELALPGAYKGADFYTYDQGCGYNEVIADPTMITPVTLLNYCTEKGLPLTLFAYAFADGVLLAHSIAEHVVLDEASPRIAFAPWETNVITAETSYSNNGDPDSLIELTRAANLGGYYQIDFRGFFEPAATVTSTHVSGDWGSIAGVSRTNDSDYSERIEYLPDFAPRRFDVAADLLPFPGLATPTELDQPRPLVQWPAPTEPLDAIFIELEMISPSIFWTFTVPPNSTSLRVPALPAEYAVMEPHRSVNHLARVLHLEIDSIADYAAFRRTTGSVLFEATYQKIYRLQPTGTVVRASIAPKSFE